MGHDINTGHKCFVAMHNARVALAMGGSVAEWLMLIASVLGQSEMHSLLVNCHIRH